MCFYKNILLIAGICIFASACSTAKPLISFEDERLQYREQVMNFLADSRFDELETEADKLRNNKARFSSGAPVLFDYYEGLNPMEDHSPSNERERRLQLLEEWQKQRPQSLTPLVPIIRAHLNLAWEARGGGWAKDVGQDRWPTFERELEISWELGQEALKKTTPDPGIYDSLLAVGTALGKPPHVLESLFQLGIRIDPGFDHLYIVMARNLLPWWNGSAEKLRAFAESVANRGDDLGKELYARIAAEALILYGTGDTRELTPMFSWERVRTGFDQLVKANPRSSFLLSVYCRLALTYGDKKTAELLFKKLDGQWSKDYIRLWASQESYDRARRYVMGK